MTSRCQLHLLLQAEVGRRQWAAPGAGQLSLETALATSPPASFGEPVRSLCICDVTCIRILWQDVRKS